MTYGENSKQIRVQLTALLRQHRIQHRLGACGPHTLPETTTVEQRREMGALIQSYRRAVLTWCLQAVTASTPTSPLDGDSRSRGPAEELRYRLTGSLQSMRTRLPSTDQLTTPQQFALVERWRQIAKAAVLGEHDFGAGVTYGRMTEQQCRTVTKDAAQITRAVLVLDKRYDNIPGWRQIPEPGLLARAATVCASYTADNEQDFTVDSRGWRPPPGLIHGGPLPGIGGVLQAQHNMLVHLARFPNALNLRRVLHGQQIVSHEAARIAETIRPDLVARWHEREHVYQQLVQDTRNIGGLIGDGGLAASEAANAVGRVRRVRVEDITTPQALCDLKRLFTGTDARLTVIVEQGVAERLYFLSSNMLATSALWDHERCHARGPYVADTASFEADLLEVVRHHLRPGAPSATAPAVGQESREGLHEAIKHQPARRTGPAVR